MADWACLCRTCLCSCCLSAWSCCMFITKSKITAAVLPSGAHASWELHILYALLSLLLSSASLFFSLLSNGNGCITATFLTSVVVSPTHLRQTQSGLHWPGINMHLWWFNHKLQYIHNPGLGVNLCWPMNWIIFITCCLKQKEREEMMR